MSSAVDNNAFEMITTPSRKRKRDAARELQPNATPSSINKPKSAAFTNAAFSSTPKKEVKSLIHKFNRFPPNKRPPLGKENANQFPNNPCLEVKSIFDLVHQKADGEPENPFEVIRKPPKKKKKAEIEEGCFVNPGLNLELPDKQFNPFEVQRDSPTKLVKAEEPRCFVNPALNIRTQETTAARNPFEIPRVSHCMESAANGIENPGLDLASGPLQIGLSFKPTIGCRIDFSNLTPSKMFAEKLVFSPMNPKTPSGLANISEADTTMDIGGELDRYQLELENSINEAKVRKTNTDGHTFGDKLEDIVEDSQEQDEIESQEPKTPEAAILKSVLNNKHNMLRLEDVDTPPIQKAPEIEEKATAPQVAVKETPNKDQLHNESFTDDEGIEYDDDDDDEPIDFKAPAPFVRAYRKADPIPPALVVHRSRESLKSEEAIPVVEAESKSKVKNMIRNSIRKLMHPNKPSKEEKVDKTPITSSDQHSTGHNLMETIRHSLRRRPQKQVNEIELAATREMSIIDATERKMKFKANLIQTDYIKIEELSTEKKPSLRSSIRKSTRGVRNQIMKSVFHKNNEEYVFA